MPRPLIHWLRRIGTMWRFGGRDREMEQEMAFHLESLRQEYVDAGVSDGEAHSLARRRFGSVLRLKEQGHEILGRRGIEAVSRDVRQVLRGYRRTPAFAIAIVVMLGLAIGANTAIFSLVDQVLLRPLPYPDGDRLVRVRETSQRSGMAMSVSPANWLDWQQQSKTMDSFAAWWPALATITGLGEPIALRAQFVSAEFFAVTGVAPMLGRSISTDDDRPGAPQVIVLSHAAWQRQFKGAGDVLGRVVQLNDRQAEIIGVMPPSFSFAEPRNDLWSAFQLDRTQSWRQTTGRFLNIVGRRSAHASFDEAQHEMESIAEGLARRHVFNEQTTVTLTPLREVLTGDVKTALWVLYAAVGALLAIACFNVANLLLARGSARRHEMAIRCSLGAGRMTMTRQLLIESLLLTLAGGLVGVVLARAVVAGLAGLAGDLLPIQDLHVDRRVLVYAAALSVAVGLVVGAAPAAILTRRSLIAWIRGSGPTTTSLPRARQGLVVLQVALTVVLLSSASLLVQTFQTLSSMDRGLDSHDLLTFEVRLPVRRYTPAKALAFYRDAIERLRRLPGARDVAASDSLAVIGPPRGGTGLHRLGTPEVPMNQRLTVTVRVVSPGYFKALGIPVLRGREYVEADYATKRPGFVVNETLATQAFAGVDPLQSSITVWMQNENPYEPVIGVVADVPETSLREPAQPTVYYSHGQMETVDMTLLVRAATPTALTRSAVAVIHDIDPTIAVSRIRTYDDALASSLVRERLSAIVAALFAVTGLVLASLGLYALMNFVVGERTREFGLRIALGAAAGRVTLAMIWQGLRLVSIGIALGVAASWVAMKAIADLFFGVSPGDLTTYVLVAVVLGVTATLASYLPARRAASVQPLIALRQE